MKTSITARHFDMSDTTREYCEAAMQGLGRYFERIRNVQIILNKEKENWISEVIVGVPGKTLTASADSDLLYKAVDEAIEKVERQIERHKARLTHERDKRQAQQVAASDSSSRRVG